MIRANPDLREAAFALSIGKGPRAPLGFVSVPARHAGVVPGMTAAQAGAVASDLTVLARNEALEQAAADAFLDVAESFSPVVEDGGPGRVYLDLAGLGGLYGSENDMALELARRVRQVGMEAEIGIAANKEIAYLAARCGGVRTIDAGRETEFLQWVPLELLELEPEVELQLERLGIRRLGELARLDPKELGSRMGAGAVELMRLVSGQTGGPLSARRPAEVFTEKTALEYAVELLEPLSFILRGLLERLTARLKLRGLTAGNLTLSLELAGRRRDERRVSVAAATNRGPLAVGAADSGFGKIAALRRRRGGAIIRAGARPASRSKRPVFAACARARAPADHAGTAGRAVRPRPGWDPASRQLPSPRCAGTDRFRAAGAVRRQRRGAAIQWASG